MTREELFRAVGRSGGPDCGAFHKMSLETIRGAGGMSRGGAGGSLWVEQAVSHRLGSAVCCRGRRLCGWERLLRAGECGGLLPSPVYSANVEIGELDGSAGHGKTASDASACLVWLDPEEVFSMATVIFRGVVRNLRYYTVTAGGTELSYTVASVEVTSSLRGDLAKGDICDVLYLGAPGRLSTSIAGDLEDLEIGREAIFMPFWATEEEWMAGRGGVFLLR